MTKLLAYLLLLIKSQMCVYVSAVCFRQIFHTELVT